MKARMWVGLFLLGCSVVGMSVAPYLDQDHSVRRAMGADIPVSPMADSVGYPSCFGPTPIEPIFK